MRYNIMGKYMLKIYNKKKQNMQKKKNRRLLFI